MPCPLVATHSGMPTGFLMWTR